ncbi:MAG: transglutaminase domain-containing protein [Oscillospiraceae bacterium]|nr:transglutaminase domain-containing protein [Oscillospiraceae bacterium]
MKKIITLFLAATLTASALALTVKGNSDTDCPNISSFLHTWFDQDENGNESSTDTLLFAESTTASDTTSTTETTTTLTTASATERTKVTTTSSAVVTTVVTTRQTSETASCTTTAASGSSANRTYSRAADSSVSRMKYWKHVSPDPGNTMKDTTLHLTSSDDLFTISKNQTWYFYHFDQSGVTGIGINGEQFHSVGYAQLYAAIEDNRYLTVSFTSDSDDIECRDITMTLGLDSSADLDTEFSRYEMQLTADLYDRCFVNGIYELDASYSFRDEPEHCTLYLFVNCVSDSAEDYEFYICYGEQQYISRNFSPAERRREITDLLTIQGVTASNSLDPDVIYPYCASSTTSDTDFWIKKSHEILDGYGNLSAGQKLLYLHDWMTSNMKYDYYKVNVLSAPRYYVGRKLDTSMYLSNNYTGVCLDFSCIYAIMCREAGIPCVVLNDNSHAWNAVYLNGDGWVEVDLTVDVNRFVYGKDLSKVSGTCLYRYEGFASFDVNTHTPDSAIRFCF